MSRLLTEVLVEPNDVNVVSLAPFERVTLENEFNAIAHELTLECIRYETLLDSADSLEAMCSLVESNPLSLESLAVPISVVSHNQLNDDISLEGIKSFLKKIWDGIVRAWNKIKAMVAKLIAWITGKGGKSQKDSLNEAKKHLGANDVIIPEIDVKRIELKRINLATNGIDAYNKSMKNLNADLQKTDDVLGVLIDSNIETDLDGVESILSDENKSKPIKEVSSKEYVDAVLDSVDATEKMAKAYQDTIKTRDDIQKTVERQIAEFDEEMDVKIKAALSKLRPNVESKVAQSINKVAKLNNDAVRDLMPHTEKAKLRNELLKMKISAGYKDRNEKILSKLKKKNVAQLDDSNSTITVREVMRILNKGRNNEAKEILVVVPEKGYKGDLAQLYIDENGEVAQSGSTNFDLHSIDASDVDVKRAIMRSNNIVVDFIKF